MPGRLKISECRLDPQGFLAAVIALMLTFCGCTNAFEDHYKPASSADERRIIREKRECQVLFYTSDRTRSEAKEKSLELQGYTLIGTSSFDAPALLDARSQARTHGNKVGADVVVLSATTVAVKTIDVPIEYPQTLLENQRCLVNGGKGRHTLMGTPIDERCEWMIARTRVPIEMRHYDASYWANPHSTTRGVDSGADHP
ncbi:hypothetical protein [Paraburkholderia caribensis]|uniref:hypothetical protein n=1 Tax=Paraburkholderia caribensis TaxID=75105 RepID=UPI001CB3B31F|nr:hypothetical protein [Paraburkholderia caribensis]CAG9269376.1 hypothetical protein PCAR4_810073 [Paraburkholderia caribensis]